MTDVAIISLGTATGSAGSVTITLETEAPAGSTLVAFLGGSGAGGIQLVADSENNFWSAVHSVEQANAIRLSIWAGAASVAIPVGGAITATWSGGATPRMVAVYALTGVVALDQGPQGVGATDTSITVTTDTLAQNGNEVVLMALLEGNGERDGTYNEADGFTSLDAVYNTNAMYVAYLPAFNNTPVSYSPSVGETNNLAAIGIVYRGTPPVQPVRRMASRIRGTPPARPRRITIDGTRTYLDGQRFFARGANWSQNIAASLDGPLLASMGGTVVRMTIGFWIDGSNPRCSVAPFNGSPGIPPAGNDAFDPNSPETGFLEATGLAFFQDEIAQALANGIMPIIAFHGGDCNFGTYLWPQDGSPAAGLTVLDMFRAAWRFLVGLYKDVDNIFCYEILAEPHPTNNPHDNSNNPPSGNGPDDTGPGGAWLYNQLIQDIRELDTWTPIAIGAVKTYNPRNLSFMMPNILPRNRYKLLAFCNFFELGANRYIAPQHSGGYVKQVGQWPHFPNGDHYVSYPNFFYDDKGGSPNAGGAYAGKGAEVYMDKAWLGGLMDVSIQDGITYNIPIIYDQFGGASGNPNYLQYVKDVCALMIERQAGGIYWAQNDYGHNGAPHGAADGFVWTDIDGVRHLKNGQDPAVLFMDIHGQFPGQQSTDDLIGVLSNFFQNTAMS